MFWFGRRVFPDRRSARRVRTEGQHEGLLMTYPSTNAGRLARVGAGLTAGAITAVGLVLCGAPAAHAAPVILTPVDVDTSATRAAGHNDFRADGVRVWTEGSTDTGLNPSTPSNDVDTWNIDKAAGYFDVHQALADVGEPSMDWSNNNAALNYRPGMQLKTDFNGDGDIDGILVGEPILADGTEFLGDRWWLAGPVAGNIDRKADLESPGVILPVDGAEPPYRQNIATLDEWRALFPEADVLQAGWSLGSGAEGDGVIYGMTVGDVDHFFSNNQNETTELLHQSDVVHTDTRATGHNDFRPTSGVRVWTEGTTSTDKATGYFGVGMPFDEIGEPSMEWRPNGSQLPQNLRPGMQLVVDIDGDDVGDGILVGEPVYADGDFLYRDVAYATNWWLNNAATPAFKALSPSTDTGSGSSADPQTSGTLAEWRGSLPPEATVVAAGWSLGSGVKGDGVIESITVGLTTYTFTGANEAPVAEDATTPAVAGGSISFPLPASDPDGDPLTYTIEGSPDADGVLEHTFSPKFIGTETFAYSVNDGNGGSDSGIVTVRVRPAPTVTTFTVKPAAPNANSTVRILIDVATTGSIKGAPFVVRVDGQKVADLTMPGDGTIGVTLGQLTAGDHEITVLVRKGTYTKSSSATETITVS